MRRRLVLCFDGTWNTPEDQTNAWRFYAALPDANSELEAQLKYYDSGVGTERSNRLGGIIGRGLDRNVLEGYCWLVRNYTANGRGVQVEDRDFEDGDEIWLIGFSRGAFTARTLAGLLGRCGLLKLDSFKADDRRGGLAFPRNVDPDHPLVRQAWNWYRVPPKRAYQRERQGLPVPELAEFRAKSARMVRIKFIGVWDTVGALGVPDSLRLWFGRKQYRFHDTNLGMAVERAYHAVAIDEHRRDYAATLWTRWRSHQDVEQRWFPGAHANVGGGYEDDLLFAPPLAWIARKAIDAGLVFARDPGAVPARGVLPRSFELRGDECMAPLRDSYREFLVGAYRWFVRRWFRPMLVDGVKEKVDEGAYRRWAADPTYRPRNLAMVGRADVNPRVRAFDLHG